MLGRVLHTVETRGLPWTVSGSVDSWLGLVCEMFFQSKEVGWARKVCCFIPGRQKGAATESSRTSSR